MQAHEQALRVQGGDGVAVEEAGFANFSVVGAGIAVGGVDVERDEGIGAQGAGEAAYGAQGPGRAAEAGFLGELAQGGLGQRLAGLEGAVGDQPAPGGPAVGLADEQEAPPPHNDGAGADGGNGLAHARAGPVLSDWGPADSGLGAGSKSITQRGVSRSCSQSSGDMVLGAK